MAEDNFKPVLEEIGFSAAAIKKLLEDGYNLQRFVKQFKKKMQAAEKKKAITEKFLWKKERKDSIVKISLHYLWTNIQNSTQRSRGWYFHMQEL